MAAFGGHLFYDLFVQGWGPWPPWHPPGSATEIMYVRNILLWGYSTIHQAASLVASRLQLVPFQWNRKMSIGCELRTFWPAVGNTTTWWIALLNSVLFAKPGIHSFTGRMGACGLSLFLTNCSSDARRREITYSPKNRLHFRPKWRQVRSACGFFICILWL